MYAHTQCMHRYHICSIACVAVAQPQSVGFQSNGWRPSPSTLDASLRRATCGCSVRGLQLHTQAGTHLPQAYQISSLVLIVLLKNCLCVCEAVCAWEIFSLGQQPFFWMDNGQVINHLESGVRLPKPERCPPTMYSLLSHCWAYEPQGRPAFSQMVCSLRYTLIVSSSVT